MRVRHWLTLGSLAAMLMARTTMAAIGDEAKRFELTPFAGYTIFDREFKATPGPGLKDGTYFGGRLSARLHSILWLDLAGGMTRAESRTDNVTWGHFSGNLMLASATQHAVSPFVSVGGGFSQFRAQLNSDKHDGLLEAAAGLKVRLSDVLGIRLEARNLLLVPRKHYEKSHLDNIVLGAGLSIGFGTRARDTDGDGVTDHHDACPDTPRGCTVDGRGCPTDADGDGVCDGIDKCPNTPRGARVDAQGCPIDDDGDGVYNGIDQCPSTPRGCKVDVHGCPLDSDGDGVCDGLDQCPETLKGCAVDAQGCPHDADNDGVCDGRDQCANTPAGTAVDSDGCPLAEVKQRQEVQQRETELLDTGMIRLHDVNFETAKANILPESREPLDVVGQVLSKWPQLKIEIGGHCDSRGSDAYNLALSNRRTASVRAYLLEHFPKLEASQLSAKGYGESRPLVPNTSPGNMAQNRRVEFVVINKEVLKQIKR